jgi:predicted esterase
MRRAAERGFRALICHGERDRSVTVDAAERSRADLDAAEVDATLRTFDAGHSIGREQVKAIAEWLASEETP